MSDPIHIISLGAGVQSSTMALMAAHGELKPMPCAAIFADTQAEPKAVYDWLDWLEKQLPFPVHRVTAGNLESDGNIVRRSKLSGKAYYRSLIPAFTKEHRRIRLGYYDEDGWVENPDPNDPIFETEQVNGMLPRKCTRDYKVYPIMRKAKEIARVPRASKTMSVIQWIGISSDEIIRMKPSKFPWCSNRWPLIEMKMSRSACLSYWRGKQLPEPPRSACVFCPYHHDREWLKLKQTAPDEFQRAVDFERNMQSCAAEDEVTRSVPYLHSSRIPLGEVEFKNNDGKLDFFGSECEGMCGV